MSYGIFARYYDLFTKNVNYKAYAEKVDSILTSLASKRGSLVDLACGTCSLGLRLSKMGYSVIGVDLSCEMLSRASKKVSLADERIMLVHQDMCKLRLPKRVDAVVCSLDALNHLSGLEAVKEAFCAVRKNLSYDGVFVFDMNTPYKHKSVLSDNCFVFDSPRAYLGWQNEYNEADCSVDITLDFFIPSGSVYKRYTENFKEIAYEQEVIEKALKECGFELVNCFDDISDNKPCETTQRILYVAKPIKE